MQTGFQLFIRAKDHDDGVLNSDDDLDDIFINQSQEPNKGYSQLIEYYGKNKRVSVRLRYRIDCQPNYYGRNCAKFCTAQNDDVNGHYTCNSADGSIQCRDGYENPSNYCRDSKLAIPDIYFYHCMYNAVRDKIGLGIWIRNRLSIIRS